MITVIGGGAAGMMAAISAAESGSLVTVIEKNERIGKKILITGKGRCNITNACPTEDFFGNIPTNGNFLYSAVYSFTNFDVMNFFEDNGVPVKVERGMRVFPQSDRAADVADALRKKALQLGVKIIRAEAKEILTENGCVKGVRTNNGNFLSDSVILAAGGSSYPRTGSDGSGVILAKKAGHNITQIRPALVPVETIEETADIMGLSLKNVKLSVIDNKGKCAYSDFGEMLFTHYGLTGPLVLSSSSHMGQNPQGQTVEIDLKPALDEKTLEKRILRDFDKYKNRNFENSLSDLLPSKLVGYIVKRSGINPYKKVNSITREERRNLLFVLKHLSFKIKGYRPVEEAIITSGGVSVKEINASTMESKIINGLYFAGEVIDVDAYTGGFNLQIAFSTGYLAGKKATEKEN